MDNVRLGLNEKAKKNKSKKIYKKKINGKKDNRKWIILIIILSFIISAFFSFISDAILSQVDILIAFIILIFIILIGILFDIIGVAVTSADEVPFHSMASRKVKGAKTSVVLIRSADKVSNFCNDVIGDICSVISGTTGAVIIGKIISQTGDVNYKTMFTIGISALVSSLTIGGKAIGKNYAISESNNIVYKVAWIVETIKRK